MEVQWLSLFTGKSACFVSCTATNTECKWACAWRADASEISPLWNSSVARLWCKNKPPSFFYANHTVQGPLPAFIVAVQSLKVSLQSFLYIHSSILFHGLQTDGRGIEVKCLHMQRASFQHQNGTVRNIYLDMPPLHIYMSVFVVLKSGGIQMTYSVSKRHAWKRW